MIAKSAPLRKCGSIVVQSWFNRGRLIASNLPERADHGRQWLAPLRKRKCPLDREIFETGLDLLLKGMRLAGAKTMGPANGYMEKELSVVVEPDPRGNMDRAGTEIAIAERGIALKQKIR